MSLIHISFPNKPEEKAKSMIEKIKNELNIKDINVISGDPEDLVILRREPTEVPELIMELNKLGIGTTTGVIDILPLKATIPDLKTKDKEESKEKISSRISQEEISKIIEESSQLDISFIVFMILASLVSASGLILNSSTILIASMILSPFMGPVLGLSFGLAIMDKSFIKNGILGQTLSIFISISLGMLMGFLSILTGFNLESTEIMISLKFPNYFDIIISICAGIAVAFSLTGTIKSALVGVAIAVALIVPAVNVGLSLIFGDLYLSLQSFILFLVNILLINICAYLIFKLKKIRPLPQPVPIWVREKTQTENNPKL